MKKIILVVFITSSICSYAQQHLYGTWNVDCPIEFIDQTSSKHCTICPTKQNSNSSLTIKGFEMTIDKDEITLNMDGTITKVKYIWHSDIHTIEFVYKEQTYKFKSLYSSNSSRYILKNEDGLLITLDEKK